MNIKRFLLLTVLFSVIPFLAKSQDRPRWIGDNAIMGRYEIVNQGGTKTYKLYDVQTKGIRIGKYDGRGQLEEDESIRFSFTDADLPCDGNVRFYKYNMDIEDWQVDNEIRVGQRSFNTTNSMVLMLVLDCSSSMDTDFGEMKQSAKDFVRQLGRNSIGSGNIHMGLICFNSVKFTDNHTYDIRPIQSQYDVDYFCTKIDQLQMSNNTAMYYAMDKGYDMIESYVATQHLKDYSSSFMVTFTDGYDNHSIYKNEKPQSGVNNPYYIHVHDIIRNKYINNRVEYKKVESFVIALKGSDVKEIERANPKFANVFKSVLEGVASDDREFPRTVKHFTLCDNMYAVKRVFNEICESLVSSWQVLNCYCAQSHDGWVQWVLECDEPEYIPPTPAPRPDPKPTSKPSPWFGISAEVGILENIYGGINFDMAFSLSNTFALGARVGVFLGSYEESYSYGYYNYYWDEYYYDYYSYKETSIGFLIGPDAKFTFPNNSAIIAGIGGGIVNEQGTVYIRAGYKTRKSFFVTGEALVGDSIGFGVGLGFSFGGKQRN